MRIYWIGLTDTVVRLASTTPRNRRQDTGQRNKQSDNKDYTMGRCKDCIGYKDETFTPTMIGIAYCGIKESKRYGMRIGAINTVVYEDSTCRYFKQKSPEQLQLFT